MFHRIGRGPASTSEQRGVVARLSECHDRIRRSLAIASRLASEAQASDQDVSAAANAVISYFVRALPHHAADEDESIAPRLAGRVDLAGVLALVREQHLDIDVTLEVLVPLWKQVAADPSRRCALRPLLEAGATKLQAQFDEHLELEETTLLPAIDELGAEVQDEIVADMIARRQ